ncbi:MAG TPA: Ig-like domain repeat protein, partial [bacterium]|nr:Ig-like domain repeat protein [bacterium]
LISEHIDSDFPLYIEPVSKNQLTENSKYYIALAALERLAVLVGERHDPALEAGAITIEQVLKALTDDLETDSKAVLDGGASINQFPVDSYLFRYWYAIALKLFLESDENLTGLKFSDLQTVISNISMDESELFPEAEKPLKVTDQPPVISEKQFRRSYETEYQNYSVENIIYANDSVFSLKFKALPDNSGDLTIDLVELFGDVEVQSLSDINEEGVYTAEVKFPVAEDGEKSIGIRAVDNAENTGMATLQAVKDTIKPVITKFELLRNEKPLTGEYTTVPFTFSYIIDELNYRDTQLAVKVVADETPFSYKTVNTVKSGAGQISTGDLPANAPDGEYIFSMKFTDKAGNEETTEFQKVIDCVSPAIDSIVMTPEINEFGFINTRNITVEITAGDNIEQTLNYWKRRNATGYDLNGNNPPNIFNIEEPADAEILYWFKVSDQAGNESAESVSYAFTIDTVKPVITISNKADLQAKSWKSSADELFLNYTIDELNRDFCELRINGAKADDITDFPTGNKSFKSNPLLDPTIGPALPNTVSIYCVDKAGNETEESVAVLIDDDAPVIAIDPASFKYNGSVVDPRVAPWTQKWVSLTMSDNFGRSKENLTLKYYYTAQITSETGINIFNRFPGAGFNELTQWTDSFDEDTGARCLISADECQFPAPHPSDTYLAENIFHNMEDRTTAFVLNVEATDQAGNKMTTSMDWTADREPVLMESGGFSYGSGKIWVSFISKKTVYSFRMIVNGVVSIPSCQHNYLDSLDFHIYSCPFTANTGTNYSVLISSVDYYNNLTTDNCPDFDSATKNYCFSGTIKASDPQLAVVITKQTNITLKYEVSSDSTITECKILKNGSYFAACSGGLTTGSKTEDISAWEDATYTIKVSAKNTLNVTSTKTASFVIDDTPTFFSLDIVNYKNLYYKEAPTLNIAATIAGGVKRVTVYLPERYVHKTRGTGFPNCTNQKCYESYEKKIFQAEPICLYNPGGGTSCFFMSYTPPADLKSGFYERVRWVIESNMNGESESGYFDLKTISKVIRVANSASDYTKINSVTLDSANKEMIVDFIPSIYSDASLSSAAGFSFKILNNPNVAKDSLYERICNDPNDNNFQKQYSFYKTKIKAVFDRFRYSSSSYKAYFKPNVNSYKYGNNNVYPDCSDNTDCADGDSYNNLSTGCYTYEEDGEILGHSCLPNPVRHYTTTASIADLNICSFYGGAGCKEYYKTCFIDETPEYSYGLEFQKRCPFLRDFWYFPKDLKIAVTDDMGKLAEVTNSSSEDYTSPETCPQQKKLDSF